jgi:hypothetical protein
MKNEKKAKPAQPAFVQDVHKQILKNALTKIHQEFADKNIHNIKASIHLEQTAQDITGGCAHLCFQDGKFVCQDDPC